MSRGQEGPLAIEGYKKLEAAQQELFDAFSACFKKVNGRNVDTFQPHEMTMLCNDACFFDLIELIRSEIELFSGEESQPIGGNAAGVVALAQARNLYMQGDCTIEAFKDPLLRTEFMGEILADLQACRMLAGKVGLQELTLEFSNKADEAKVFVTEIANKRGVRISSKGGAYAGKGKSSKGKASGGATDEKAQILEQVADEVVADQNLPWPEHLLYPEWTLDDRQERMVNDVIEVFNKEYTTRRKVLTRRLDVTIQAFLWSPKADQYMEQFSQAIAAVMDWRDRLGAANISKWSMFAAGPNATIDSKVSSVNAISSVVKTVIIGAVPDRGGVPEGYTVEDITKDIVKANVALTFKDDGGKGKAGASAQKAGALAAKRWVGKGMGGGLDQEPAPVPTTSAGGGYYGSGGGKGGKGGGGGGYYGSGGDKGGGGKSGGDNKGGGGGYYGSKGGGDKGGGGGGGGGGFYASQSTDSGGGGGGGYYGGGKDGGGKDGGGKSSKGSKDGGGKSSKGGSKGGGDSGDSKGGGGGFYAQQGGAGGGGGSFYGSGGGDDSGGGGGGFYAQQGGGGGGGFYAQQSGGGGGGGGGFYAQQSAGGAGGGGFYGQGGGGGGGGGGFYAQQDAGGGGGAGGFYAQQSAGGGGGFYAQQQGGAGGGGFYGQQGGGGFYDQQGGGGFYDQSGGGGGGFYAQGGGGGGGGFYAQGGGGGGGGFGGRSQDLPATAKGWKGGGRK